jgi:hypothetical protein
MSRIVWFLQRVTISNWHGSVSEHDEDLRCLIFVVFRRRVFICYTDRRPTAPPRGGMIGAVLIAFDFRRRSGPHWQDIEFAGISQRV